MATPVRSHWRLAKIAVCAHALGSAARSRAGRIRAEPTHVRVGGPGRPRRGTWRTTELERARRGVGCGRVILGTCRRSRSRGPIAAHALTKVLGHPQMHPVPAHLRRLEGEGPSELRPRHGVEPAGRRSASRNSRPSRSCRPSGSPDPRHTGRRDRRAWDSAATRRPARAGRGARAPGPGRGTEGMGQAAVRALDHSRAARGPGPQPPPPPARPVCCPHPSRSILQLRARYLSWSFLLLGIPSPSRARTAKSSQA